jgi:hypothetical protein
VRKPRVHASPHFAPFMLYARARSEFHFFRSIWGPAWRCPAREKPATGPKMVRSPSNHVYTHRHSIPHARRRRELHLNFVFFPWICGPRGPARRCPGAGQKRAAGPKMACSSSNYVYTHRRNFLHFCRKRERDLNLFIFPGFAGPGPRWALPGAGQKRAAGPKMVCSL